MHRRIFGKMLVILPPKVCQYIGCVFSRGTTRSTSAPIATRTRLFHRQYIARYFGPRGTLADYPIIHFKVVGSTRGGSMH